MNTTQMENGIINIKFIINVNNYDERFLSVFNEYYPFERYIFNTPRVINDLFDDIVLTEIFVPYTEIKPICNPDTGDFMFSTTINKDEVYVKVRGKAGEMRLGYFDFAERIRENIRDVFIKDFGQYNYESLYVNHEEDDNSELEQLLKDQYNKIFNKYGKYDIKKTVRDNLV